MYVAHLLGLDVAAQERWQHAHLSGDRSKRPGMVRVSFGAYNTVDDVDALVAMLQRITRDDYGSQYCQVPESGDFRPVGHDDGVHNHFSLSHRRPLGTAMS
jgi:hypothetical protein